jgi:hypothetical protein
VTEHEHNQPDDDEARRARAADLREQTDDSQPDEAEPSGGDHPQHLSPREFTERSVRDEREEQED